MKSVIILFFSLPTLLALSCSVGEFDRMGVCRPCNSFMSHCGTCNSSISCTMCEDRFGIYLGLYDNYCIVCTDSNCAKCSNNNAVCQSCNNVTLALENGVCKPCSDPKCTDCSTTFSVCKECTLGYYGVVKANNTCELCKMSNCYDCKYDYQICTSCVTRYGADLLNMTVCRPCSLFCVQCTKNYLKCTQCSWGYFIGLTFLCQSCPSVCVRCNSFNSCLQCKAGYGLELSIPRLCVKCTQNCQLCQTWYNNCKYCQQFYGLDLDGSCTPCQLPCKNCTRQSDYFKCVSCYDGYFLQGMKCHKCPQFYKRCEYQDPDIVCLQATQGDILYFDVINQCKQTCGDSVAKRFDCDNEIGIAYDGCDDNCEVMDNFTCRVTDQKTKCSYTGDLKMNLISFKKEKDWNSFTMIVEIVEPILYSFLALTDEESFEMFSIDHPSIKVTSVRYDIVRNQIIFVADFYDDLVDLDKINVTFHQSYVNDQSFQIQFYFDNQNKPIFISYFYCNIIWYGSCFVVFIGWISFILGILVRKLYGIEVIMMLQLCWISILWNMTRQYMFFIGKISPLKLSSGYNIKLFEQQNGIILLQGYEYFNNFGMLNKLFVNNFNLGILFVLVPGIFVGYFYLRFNMKRRDLKRSVMLQNSDDVLIIYQKYLTKSCQILMQGCMVLIPYYCQCLVLFLRYGQVLNIPSIIILTICGVIIVCCLISFIWNPMLFEYFRISFVVKLFALNYWLIHVLVVVGTILIITIVPQMTYIALIPSFLMLIFISVYRPYCQSKHNITSFLNYFVVICFLLLRIGQVYIPISTYGYRDIFMYCLLFLVCGLLPIIICINNGMMIYDYFMMEYISKIQNAVKVESREMMERKKLLEEISIVNVKKRLKKCDVGMLKTMLPVQENVLDCSNALIYDMLPLQKNVNRNKSLMETLKNGTKYQSQQVRVERIKKYSLIKQKIKREGFKRSMNRKDLSDGQRYDWIECSKQQKQQGYIDIKREQKQQQNRQQLKQQQNKYINDINMKILKQQNKYINYKNVMENIQGIVKQDQNLFVKIYQEI